MQSKAWLLYLGLIFLFMVMYAPGGVASLIMMNLRVLALKLPEQPETAAEHGADEEPAASNLSDFKPFERGPEITEIH